MNSKVITIFWACPRQMTSKWGCATIHKRIEKELGKPDIVFGKTDGIPSNVITVDKDPNVNPTHVCEWKKLPFADNQFEFGFWDPPYDKMYLREYEEIWRVCKRLAILHTLIMTRPLNAKRTHMIAITTGPYKRIRCLQVFEKKNYRLEV
jgi:hypothetical protein